MPNIDLSYLQNISGGDNEIIIEMLDLIIEQSPDIILNMRRFYEQKEWAQMGKEAHKLKPLLLYVGLAELKEVTQNIEDSGRNESNLNQVLPLIDKLEREFNVILPELKKQKSLLS